MNLALESYLENHPYYRKSEWFKVIGETLGGIDTRRLHTDFHTRMTNHFWALFELTKSTNDHALLKHLILVVETLIYDYFEYPRKGGDAASCHNFKKHHPNRMDHVRFWKNTLKTLKRKLKIAPKIETPAELKKTFRFATKGYVTKSYFYLYEAGRRADDDDYWESIDTRHRGKPEDYWTLLLKVVAVGVSFANLTNDTGLKHTWNDRKYDLQEKLGIKELEIAKESNTVAA